MLIKIHKSYRNVVAICDSDLIDKKFEQGNAQLDLTSNFYGRDEKSLNETIRLMKEMAKEDATFNIVGKQSIEAAKQAGIVSDEGIKTIQEIPYALVLL